METNPPRRTDDWHVLSLDATAQRLRTHTEQGLHPDTATIRLAEHGRNEIAEGKRRGPLAVLAAQFTDFLILILIAAAVIAGFIGDVTDTVVILAIVVLNALVGFIQEYRAERAVAALRRMAAPSAVVVRAGVQTCVPAAELVPGDLVALEAGNVVPADMRLVETQRLKVEEAALTGESLAVDKHTAPLREHDVPLGDRRNMAYKGTMVTYGRALGIVVATAMATELGRIAQLLHGAEDVRTPLQKRLARFGRVIAIGVIVLCGLLFVIGVLRGEPVTLMLLTAISLAVAAIPEALPAVVTVALALGARKMVKQNALIRRLPAVETLGSVTYICSDKTGTLTENRMRVEEIYAGERRLVRGEAPPADDVWRLLFQALAISNDARAGEGRVLGDPTEVALYDAAAQAGFRKEELVRSMPRVGELPFDSERARMTTFHAPQEAGGQRVVAFVKGAPEGVLQRCHDAMGQAFDRSSIENMAERMAAEGLRVLAVALRRFDALPSSTTVEEVERDLTFLGLIGMLDPPRAEAAQAVAECRSAGITPVMITGDHPATARAIAKRLGIIGADERSLSGKELERLPDEAFAAEVERIRVYARVAPAQKIRIVRALQEKGEHVAMTGDGVNDAPALKRADIGVAMGITGTDVSKEAAHMILLDDNFATIVSAVREGRRIYDNILKFIKFIMTGNSGEILTLFLAPFFGLPIPLLPIHILWVNLVTDGLPGLALAAERGERDLMRRPPRPPGESVFAHGLWQHIVWVGLLIAALCLITQAWAIENGAHAQTMVFTVLTGAQMFHVLAIRSERESLFAQGMFGNRPMLAALLFTLLLHLALIYVPVLNPVFRTQPLGVTELLFCLAISSVTFFAVEIEKWLRRRDLIYRADRFRSVSVPKL